MKHKKRTEWILWECDLEGCTERSATHKEFGDPTLPEGWRTIDPPRIWRGPSLAFCTQAHYERFVGDYVRPLLTGGAE